MYRLFLLFTLSLCLLAGCGRSKPAVDPRQVVDNDKREDKPEVKDPVIPVKLVEIVDDHSAVAQLVANVTRPSDQERFDAALLEALGFLADKKYNQALLSLETARSIQDTETVRQQIRKVKALMDQQVAAEKSVQDIQTVLDQGKPEDAAKLSTAALRQFGGSDAAPALSQLKEEADAVVSAPGADKDRRRDQLLREAQSYVADDNRRAAAIAFEQALQIADDPAIRKQYDNIRTGLTRYDEQRSRAAQLRRDPTALEDAIAALRDAQKLWDTPLVRLELDEYTFALQKRRDRLSVADFEVRGDVGVPQAGRTVAETLLPTFKSRFDLVEREQLNQLVSELKLEAGNLGDPSDGRQELGRLARIRYLVVGSVTPLEGGVNVNARLVEVQTGLVVQTARLSAPTMTVLLDRLPQLAQMLTMSDDQRMAFEQALAEKAAAVDLKPIEPADLPPPPPPFDPAVAPPAPVITYSARPLALGGLTFEDFRSFTPVLLEPAPPVEVVLRRDDPRRRRMLQLSLDLGDNLFRRGRWREANRHFSLALNFCDDQAGVQVRLDRCRPFLPPPVPISRPRLIVFNFLLNTPPGLVPPAMGDWAADQLGSYFCQTHEIVDRGEVCWYMGRLGITMRDILNDPGARVCLAQALNVRYFVYGAIVQTGSFNVETHLIDAQSGSRTGTGTIHVQDHEELKLRLHELAQQMGSPKDQPQLVEKSKQSEKALNSARTFQKAGNYAQAAEVARTALAANPENIALKSLVQQIQAQALQAEREAGRQREAARYQADLEAARKQQDELVKQTRAARLKVEQEAKARTDAARQTEEASKQRAAEHLRDEARLAEKRGDLAAAAVLFRSAVALKASDAGYLELARVQARLDEQKRKTGAEELMKKVTDARKAREAAQARIEEEKKRLAADDALRRKLYEDRDRVDYARLVDQARTLLNKGEYDKAQSVAQSARLIKPGDEVNRLLVQVLQARELAEAKKKGDQASKDVARRIEEEKRLQEKADLEAKKKEEDYGKAIKGAQAALADKKYDLALTYYQDASKLFKTDAVLSGMKTAADLRDRARAQAESEQRAKAEEERRTVLLKKLLSDGAKALDAKEYDGAIKAYSEAVRLAPGNVDALAGKSKAEQGKTEYLARNRDKVEQEQRQAQVRRLLDNGKTALAAKRYDEAVAALSEAGKLNPKDADIAALLKDAERRRDAGRADELALKKRQEQYQGLLKQGKADLVARKFDDAIKHLSDATKIIDDPTGRDLLRQAQQAKIDAGNTEKVRDLVGKARVAITAKKFDDAELYLGAAKKLIPGDATVATALKDLEAARKPTPGDLAKLKQRQEDFKLAIDAGRDAYKKGNYVGAVNAFKQAVQLMSDDKDAQDMLRGAELARDEEVKKKADFTRLMNQARTAMTGKKYVEAITAYTEALKLVPNDADAKKGLADAKQLTNPPPPPPTPQAEYNRQMQLGATLEQQKKYADAIKAYSAALKAFPNDARATGALKEASFKYQMAEGLKAAQAKNYSAAVKAYEEALKLKPRDADATAALKRAKDGKP